MSSRPEKPTTEDCCGSGCNPCIFDVYEKQLALWESRNVEQTRVEALNPLKYSPFCLESISRITPDTNLYTFQAVDEIGNNITGKISLKMGDYAILKGSSENANNVKENISRPYTIILNDLLKSGSFQVLIKLYPNGKMSQFLQTSQPNDVLFWRGPYNHFPFKETSRILLVGAGTGIVPLYNIAKELVLNENCDTLVKMAGCFQCLEAILLRDELLELSHYWNFEVDYFISRKTEKDPRYAEKVHFSKFDSEVLKNILANDKPGEVLVVICGPDSFNSLCKGVISHCGIGEEYISIL